MRSRLPVALAVVFPVLPTILSACYHNLPEPSADLIEDFNWRPPPADRLDCLRGPTIQVLTSVRATVHDSAGYLDCQAVVPEPDAQRSPLPSEVLLTAESADGYLDVWSDAAEPIYFLAVARRAASGLAWQPCPEPGACRFVHRGVRHRIPFDRIAGWMPGEKAVVLYAWRLVPAGEGRWRPDRVRAVLFPLVDRSGQPAPHANEPQHDTIRQGVRHRLDLDKALGPVKGDSREGGHQLE